MNSEFFKRFLSSIFLIPTCFFFIIKGSVFFNIFIFICLLICIYEWQMMSKQKIYNIFGYLFLFFSFYCIHNVRNDNENFGLNIFLFILIICISTDLGGYIFGKVFKGPKLTIISPNKTFSGVFGSYFLSILVIYFAIIYSDLFSNILSDIKINVFALAIIISTISQIGDISISFFKRLSKIKDTGKLIPGHGGILDRVDGMIFAYPFYYIFKLLL